MRSDIVIVAPPSLARLGIEKFPAVISRAGETACQRFLTFFTANIRSRNTDMAYARAVVRFLEWRDAQGWCLEHIAPMDVAAYVAQLQEHASVATVKQQLTAIRQLFDWLVSGQVLLGNPARAGRGPHYRIVASGKHCW